MNKSKFKFGYYPIDEQITFDNDDLIVIASHPEMRTEVFALNIMKRNNDTKGCFFSLITPQKKLEITLSKINKCYKLSAGLSFLGIEELKGNFDCHYLHLPTTLELLETIVNLKNDYDYFVIDSLTFIDTNLKPVFSKDKNYQSLLRHLKIVAKTINKPIILLSSFSVEMDDYPVILYYYGIGEEYIDYIFTFYIPDYYNLLEEDTEVIIDIVKTKTAIKETEISLIYDYSNCILS